MFPITYRWVIWAAAGLLALIGSPDLALAQASCGPSAHWIDNCIPTGGSDIFPSSGAVVGIDLDFDCVRDQNIVLSGPTTVQRQGASDVSTNFPGQYGSSPDSHIDVIDTEIVSMSLVGGGVTLTAGQGTTPGGVTLAPTKGTVVEQASDITRADSMFEVFFEVGLGGGTFLYNQTALLVTSVIRKVPPDVIYIHQGGCTHLFTQQAGGIHFANLVSARHVTDPENEIPTLTEWGLIVMSLLLAVALTQMWIYPGVVLATGEGPAPQGGLRTPLFEPRLYLKAFASLSVLWILGLAGARALQGSLSDTDLIGSLICLPLAAWLVQLWWNSWRRKD